METRYKSKKEDSLLSFAKLKLELNKSDIDRVLEKLIDSNRKGGNELAVFLNNS